jgi:integrase
VRIPQEVVDLLKRYQAHQAKQIEDTGDKWAEQIKGLNDVMVNNDRLFTRWNGRPMNMDSPHGWFEKFCDTHGLRYVNIHSWRHFNASVLIFKGIDVKSVQCHLGHSTANTTLSIYSHEFQKAKVANEEAISSVLSFKSDKSA